MTAESMTADVERFLALRLAERLRSIQQRTDMPVSSALEDLTSSAAAAMNADYAGITVVDAKGRISTLGATHPYPALLDKIQETHREGPCVAAAWDHHTMRIDDVGTDRRWPRYCREVIDQTPIRSIVSFQLYANRRSMAALSFYAEQPRAFDHGAIEIGLIFAAHTAIAWNMLKRDDQFRSALESRDIIGQAKGMLMERFHVDAVHAFELLKRLSQESNMQLVEVARQLVYAERPDDE